MSLDGYVATKEDDLSFLSQVAQEGEDYGYADFTNTIDTYIVGRKTYQVVKQLLNGHFPKNKSFKYYVVTRQSLPQEDDITFYQGDLRQLIEKLKSEKGKDIFCDGGPQVVKLLLEQCLIDEFIISIVPVLLGSGKRLFLEDVPFLKLVHTATKSYPSGLVQLHYRKYGG